MLSWPVRALAGFGSSTHCSYRRSTLRLWVIGFGLGLESFGDIWALRLVTFWDVWHWSTWVLPGYLSQLLRPTNPSMGLELKESHLACIFPYCAR